MSDLHLKKQRLLRLKKEQLAAKRSAEANKPLLPHLYGRKHYKWSREFDESTNRVNLLCAANQISKSSTAIRRCITNATDKKRWEKLWGKGVVPGQFWYFYPDSGTLKREWLTKWQEWMPKGDMKDSPVYGWKHFEEKGVPTHITFRSGVTVFFQFYTKSVSVLQSSTVHEIYVDEELPMHFYDELMFRLTNTNGIFNAVFTPTLNQLFWYQAMETDEVLKTAWKRIISMYECVEYEDGTPGAFTVEKIEKEIIPKCKNETEVQRRVFGRFVTEEGRTFYAFEYEKHFSKEPVKDNLLIYAGADPGSGGANHPAALVFLAVEPDHKKAYVKRVWRGDGIETTAGDAFNKYMEMRNQIKGTHCLSVYDHSAKDFGTIAARNGVSFLKADKSRESGEALVNTLFKHNMLVISNDDPENLKLCEELNHFMKLKSSKQAKDGDDLCDALRYACMMVPWDLTVIEENAREVLQKAMGTIPAPKKTHFTEAELIAEQIRQRRGEGPREEQDEWQEITDEMEYWNEQYG